MATVRFSKELQERIISNARAVFDKQERAAQEARPSDEWGDKVYDILFGQHVAALNAVPHYFLNMNDKIKVERVGDHICGIEFKLGTPRPFPKEFPDVGLAKKTGYYEFAVTLHKHPAWAELEQDVLRWKSNLHAVRSKREDFVESVKKIIETHATLAPALKMWQPLWDLIPEDVKDKHREIKERSKREVAVEGVDLSSMTAAVVANKLTN
jgi:hypothetical protein